MEITLEKIELVKDRTGVTYKEAKEALEKADGNVVEAIISIEDNIDTKSSSEKIGAHGEALLERMKEVVRKGNIARILVRRGDEVILNLPVNAGVLGAIVAPWGVIIGVLAAFSFKCQVEMVKDDGEIVNISDKVGDIYDGAVAKSTEIYDDIKEKAPEVYETIKDRAPEVYETIKEKSDDVAIKAKDIAKDASEAAIGVASRFKKKEDLNDLDEDFFPEDDSDFFQGPDDREETIVEDVESSEKERPSSTIEEKEEIDPIEAAFKEAFPVQPTIETIDEIEEFQIEDVEIGDSVVNLDKAQDVVEEGANLNIELELDEAATNLDEVQKGIEENIDSKEGNPVIEATNSGEVTEILEDAKDKVIEEAPSAMDEAVNKADRLRFF